jgi:hypothetical protein
LRKKEKEANLFRLFLSLQPLFAGEPIAGDWCQPAADPPDILCRTASGRMVGVELGSWLDERQTKLRRRRERIETDIRAAIGEQPKNSTRHFRFVWLHPKDTVRMHEINASDFRSELLALIARADCEWAADTRPRSSERVVPDPSSYPAVARVLHSIQCSRRKVGGGPAPEIPWIIFPSWSAPYHARSMVEALQRCLSEKREKYRSSSELKSLAEFVLIVHYDEALLYNAPSDAPDYRFEEAIGEARVFLGGDPGTFTRIFALIALDPVGRVFQLYPHELDEIERVVR